MYKVKIFRGVNKQWYWSVTASNGKIVCSGGEGFKRRTSVIKIVQKLFGCNPKVVVMDDGDEDGRKKSIGNNDF